MRTQKLSLAEALGSARETKILELGQGMLNGTPRVFQKLFPNRPAVIVADTATFRIAGQTLFQLFADAGVDLAEPYIFDARKIYADHEHVVQLAAALNGHEAIPVAVGSGTINDLTKLAAFRTGRPYLAVATAASMDGYTAFGASITHDGSKQTFDCPAPVAVVADVDILRKAPASMTASGYADLLAKVTAGADWILADALRVEAIDPRAWNIVQGGLREALHNPAAIGAGDAAGISRLAEGLMLGGFAMQWSKSSRPASGAEHQFSHLWDMQHHTFNGHAPSHGAKVGIATLAVTALYEYLLAQPLENLAVERCCENWPSGEAIESGTRKLFAGENFVEKVLGETRAKHIERHALQAQLEQLKQGWPGLREQLREQLIPFDEASRMLREVGAPHEPEQIGISRARLKTSFRQAWHIRRRFTVLDVAMRTGILSPALDAIFGPGGRWPVAAQELPANVSL